MLVIDASVALRAWDGERRFELLGEEELVAPPLLWSEFYSSVHEASWRREVSSDRARALVRRLEQSPIHAHSPPRLRPEAWRLADELGWAKTYDAEYVALAHLLDCRLVTVDGRLRRGADRLGMVVTPNGLGGESG